MLQDGQEYKGVHSSNVLKISLHPASGFDVSLLAAGMRSIGFLSPDVRDNCVVIYDTDGAEAPESVQCYIEKLREQLGGVAGLIEQEVVEIEYFQVIPLQGVAMDRVVARLKEQSVPVGEPEGERLLVLILEGDSLESEMKLDRILAGLAYVQVAVPMEPLAR